MCEYYNKHIYIPILVCTRWRTNGIYRVWLPSIYPTSTDMNNTVYSRYTSFHKLRTSIYYHLNLRGIQAVLAIRRSWLYDRCSWWSSGYCGTDSDNHHKSVEKGKKGIHRPRSPHYYRGSSKQQDPLTRGSFLPLGSSKVTVDDCSTQQTAVYSRNKRLTGGVLNT